MLTGRLPFAAESLMEMFLAQTNQRPASIVAMRPDCPPRLAEVVERMMSKSPEDRWPSLDDVLGALSPLHAVDARDGTRGSMVAIANEDDGRVHEADFSRPVSPSPVNAPKRISERAAAKVQFDESARPRGRIPWWVLPAILIPIVAGVLWVAALNSR
jgi:hypothetical protein